MRNKINLTSVKNRRSGTMFRKYTLILVFCCAGVVYPYNVIPCRDDDSCADTLFKASIPTIFAGFPELGIEPSDPLYVEELEGNLSVLKFKFFNSTATGYKDCTYSNLKVSQELKKLHFDMDCPEIKMSGKYEITGQLVIMPVDGNGDYSMVTGKYHIAVDSDLKTTKGNDGKTHLSIKNLKLKCTPLTGLKFDFKNLFNGQKTLSDAVHKFAHENWREVADLVQDPVWYGCLGKIMKNMNKRLKYVALEDYKKI